MAEGTAGIVRYEGLFISGLGVSLPPLVDVGIALADGTYDPADHAAYGYRSIAIGEEPAPEMAARAGAQALARSGLAPEDVAILLHACSWFQGVDYWPAASFVHRRVLPGARAAPAIEVHQMSNSALAAVELAASHLLADPARRAALVTTADAFRMPGFDRFRSDAGMVYGDGGAAVVLGRAGFARLLSLVTVTESGLEAAYRGSEPFRPASGAAGGPVDVRRRRGEFLENADAQAVGERISAGLADTVAGALDEAGTKPDEIARFVFPNIGLYVLRERYAPLLGIEVERTAWEYGSRTGHVGSADQLTGLDHLVTTGQVGPGDRVALVGLGAGFSWSGAVVEVLERPAWTEAEDPRAS